MPDEIAANNTALAAQDPEDVREAILSFFSAEGLSRAYILGGWSAEKEVRMLREIAESGAYDPMTRMGAISLLRRHAQDALRFSGYLQETNVAQVRLLPDGGLQTASVQGGRLAGPSRTQAMLEAGLATANVLEARSTKPDEDIIDTEEETLSDDRSEPDSPGHSGVDAADPVRPGPGGPPADPVPGGHSGVRPAGVSPQHRHVGQPDRDLGGGGLCRSAQVEALSAREKVAAAHEAAPTRLGPDGLPLVPAKPGGDSPARNREVPPAEAVEPDPAPQPVPVDRPILTFNDFRPGGDERGGGES